MAAWVSPACPRTPGFGYLPGFPRSVAMRETDRGSWVEANAVARRLQRRGAAARAAAARTVRLAAADSFRAQPSSRARARKRLERSSARAHVDRGDRCRRLA